MNLRLMVSQTAVGTVGGPRYPLGITDRSAPAATLVPGTDLGSRVAQRSSARDRRQQESPHRHDDDEDHQGNAEDYKMNDRAHLGG